MPHKMISQVMGLLAQYNNLPITSYYLFPLSALVVLESSPCQFFPYYIK